MRPTNIPATSWGHFIKSIICVIAFTVFGFGCREKINNSIWPGITSETKPWTRWWWQGNSVTKAGVTAELESLQHAGFGGVEITPIYGVIGDENNFVEYLSEEWMELFIHTLAEAERLEIGIDMATGTGWPFGGPWVNEDQACKYLTFRSYKLKTGEKLAQKIISREKGLVRSVTNKTLPFHDFYQKEEKSRTDSLEYLEKISKEIGLSDLIRPVEANKNLQELALDQVRYNVPQALITVVAFDEQQNYIDLTEKVNIEGTLEWTAPRGTWSLYALFEGQHGKMVERAAPGGEGNVIDHFSSLAIQNYLNKFDTVFSDYDITYLRSFFNDSYEVDDAIGQANWTPLLFDEFLNRRGYDLRWYLPILFDQTHTDHIRIISDFRETFSELLLENFTGVWKSWAETHAGLTRNQAHGSPANLLDLYGLVDIPETEGTDIIRIKTASSAGHTQNKKLISAETATWLDEHFLSDFAALKENVDRYFLGGVNHVVYHGTCYSPNEDSWPGRLFYAAMHINDRNPMWNDLPAFNKYVTNVQSFLQAGKPENEVLLYFPIYDRFATPGKELLEHFDGSLMNESVTPVRSMAENLYDSGISFDLISDHQLNDLIIDNRKIITKGISYKTLLIPQSRFFSLATMEKILSLAKEGATILFYKSLPKDIPGFHNTDKKRKVFQGIIEKLKNPQDRNGISTNHYGSGKIMVGSKIDQLVESTNVRVEKMVNAGLEFIKRKSKSGSIYFIANWSDHDISEWIPFQASGAQIILVDPETGAIGKAAFTPRNNDTEVLIDLEVGKTLLVLFTDDVSRINEWKYYNKGETSLSLNDNWSLNFTKGGPQLPPAITNFSLKSWAEVPAMETFSGTAQYEIVISKQSESAVAYRLDLGKVYNSTQIFFNGQLLGSLFGPTYAITIPGDLWREENTLQIEVSNLMANRIIDLEKRKILWKKFYNINFPSRDLANRDPDGLFTAIDWDPLPSGLLGPVTLSPLIDRNH